MWARERDPCRTTDSRGAPRAGESVAEDSLKGRKGDASCSCGFQHGAGASLRVAGTDLDPDYISKSLGVESTHFHKRGDLNHLREPYPRDLWLVQSPQGQEKPLEEHLLWLGEKLIPNRDSIRKLRSSGCAIDIYCWQSRFTEQGAIVLSVKAMDVFRELDCELQVSVLCLPYSAE